MERKKLEISEKNNEWYGIILEELTENDYTPSMADAAFLREKLRECGEEELSAPNRSLSDAYLPYYEAIARWVWQMYAVNYEDFNEKDRKLMYDYVKRIREQKELL